MASIKDYKIKNVETIKKRLDGARAIVLVDYKGITVEEVNKLRNQFRAANVDYFISKNTWIKIALNDLKINQLDSYLKGTTAIAVSKVDEVMPAKVLKKFAETELDKKDYCKFKVGLIGDGIYSPAQLAQLALLPSKEELYSKVLAGINTPATGLVGVMNGVIAKLARAIEAVAKKKAQ